MKGPSQWLHQIKNAFYDKVAFHFEQRCFMLSSDLHMLSSQSDAFSITKLYSHILTYFIFTF